MPRFIAQIIESYRLTFIFILAAFPLLCVPIFFEGLQHIAEFKLGMFAVTEPEDFSDEAQNKRILFGIFKVLSLVATIIFLPRYFIHGRDLKRTLQFSPKARRVLSIGFMIMVFVVLWMFILGPWIIEILLDNASIKQKTILPLLVVLLMGFPLQNRMNAWIATVFDDSPIAKEENRSLNKAMMGGLSPVIIITILPLFILHYVLNMASMGQTLPKLWMLLTLDSILVGVLAALMGAVFYVVYRDARRKFKEGL